MAYPEYPGCFEKHVHSAAFAGWEVTQIDSLVQSAAQVNCFFFHLILF
jgi:hypothetical protein